MLPYNEFLFDASALSLQEADYVIHRKLVNYDYLIRRQKDGVYKNISKIKDNVFTYEDDDVLNKPHWI